MDNKNEYSLITVGLDWITAVGKGLDATNKLAKIAHLASFEDTGERQREYDRWGAHGYLGWRTKHVRFGTRHDGAVLQLVSGFADMYKGLIYSGGFKVTRIDLQVTMSGGILTDSYTLSLYRDLTAASQSNNQRKYSLIVDTLGGDTLYVGSRSSEQCGRIYDKFAQSKGREEYKGAYRYEVEFKGDKAASAFAIFGREDVLPETIRDTVMAWFAARNVTVPFAPTENMPSIMTLSKSIGKSARRLQWLQKQIKPIVEQLVLEGFKDEVEKAIGFGLDDLNTVDVKE